MDPNTSWRLSKLQVAVIQTVSGTFTESPLKFSFSLAGQRAGRNLSQLLWRGQRSSQRKTCRNHPLGNSFPFTVSSHKRALQSVTKSTDARKVPSCIQVWEAARLAHRLTKSAGWAGLQQTAFCTLSPSQIISSWFHSAAAVKTEKFTVFHRRWSVGFTAARVLWASTRLNVQLGTSDIRPQARKRQEDNVPERSEKTPDQLQATYSQG